MLLEGTPRDNTRVASPILMCPAVSLSQRVREEVGVQVKFLVHDFPLLRIDIHDVPLRYRIGTVSAILGRVPGRFTHKGRAMFGRSELSCSALPLVGFIWSPLDRPAVREVSDHVVALHGESIFVIQLGNRRERGDLVWRGRAGRGVANRPTRE